MASFFILLQKKARMKSIMIIMLALIANVTCSSKEQEPKSVFKVVYKAQTRGANIVYIINKDSIKATTIGYEGVNGGRALKSVDKKEIVALIEAIELETIKNLNPPSQESAVDKSLIASVQIIENGKEYESSTFDHGNPPMELKPLVDKILALIETVE